MGRPTGDELRLARRHLQGQRQLLPLGELARTAGPPAAAIIGGSYAEAFGTAALADEHLDTSRRHLRRRHAAALRQRDQVASTAKTGNIATSTNPLTIGSDPIYGQYFHGLIDEVRIYNVALTAAQIQADMTTPVTGGAGPATRNRRRLRSPRPRLALRSRTPSTSPRPRATTSASPV